MKSAKPTRGRPPGSTGKSPIKTLISIRLDAALVGGLKAGGAGWQSKLNEDLLRLARTDQLKISDEKYDEIRGVEFKALQARCLDLEKEIEQQYAINEKYYECFTARDWEIFELQKKYAETAKIKLKGERVPVIIHQLEIDLADFEKRFNNKKNYFVSRHQGTKADRAAAADKLRKLADKLSPIKNVCREGGTRNS